MSIQKDGELVYKFLRRESTVVQPVTSFWVYNTNGGLLIDLCYDRPRPTLSVTHKLGPDNVVGAQTDQQSGAEVIREVMASVEMSPQSALELGKYLVEVAKKRGAVDTPGEQDAPAGGDSLH